MTEETKRKYKVAYAVVEREKDGKSFWTKVGAAFPNRDGSLSVWLDAMPINGKIQIRDPQPPRSRESEKAA